MSLLRSARPGLAVGFGVCALSLGGSCHRAEIDLSPLVDDMSQVGAGATMSGAGEPSSGGSVAALECDATPEDPLQTLCRQRPAAKQQCAEVADPGWAGCYDGGCSICTEVLVDFPYYFDWHVCCLPSLNCNADSPSKCSALCPRPTELDKVQPCFATNL